MDKLSFTPLKSSALAGYRYDDSRWVLVLQFNNGSVSAYQQVPPETFEEFLAAESQGKFWNANIKGKFDVVHEEAPAKPVLVAGKAVEPDADLSKEIPAVKTMHLDPAHQEIVEIGYETLQARREVRELTWDDIGKASDSPLPPAKTSTDSAETGGDPTMQDCYVHMKPTVHWKRPYGSWCCSECHPDPNIEEIVVEPTKEAVALAQTRSLDIVGIPEMLPPLPVPTTPAEALKLVDENEGLIQATIKKGAEIAAQAMQLKVSDAKSYEAAGESKKFLVGCQDRAVKFLDPIRAILYSPYQKAQQYLKAAKDPFDQALQYLTSQRLVWDAEQERIRLAEEARLRREQEEQAERDRQARSQQLTLEAVGQAIQDGDIETAEKLVDEPINVPGEYVAPVHVESTVPKTAGISKRKNWVATVTNLEDLILDVAEGICSTRDGRGLQGHAPVTFLQVDQTKLNQSAKSQEKAFKYPGVVAENKATESVRRSK